MTILANTFLILAIIYIGMAITLTIVDHIKKHKTQVRKDDIIDFYE